MEVQTRLSVTMSFRSQYDTMITDLGTYIWTRHFKFDQHTMFGLHILKIVNDTTISHFLDCSTI